MALKVFHSYCHKDAELHQRLWNQLSIFERTNRIVRWDDREIKGGEDWETAISEKLDEADIILLEVTENFIASGYCWGIEMRRAMELRQSKRVRVVPVYLSACVMSGAPFEKLQRLPGGDRPVDEYNPQSAALKLVAEAFEQLLPQPAREPLARGRLAYTLCDRRSEARRFHEFVKAHTGLMLCIIQGENQDCPESLAERLAHQATPSPLWKRMTWHVSADLLMSDLEEELKWTRDRSMAAIYYGVPEKNWDESLARELLERLAARVAVPQLVVFLGITFRAGSRLKQMPAKATPIAGVPCLVLRNLPLVDEDDVREALRDHGIPEEELSEKVRKIFGDATELPMEKIQKELKSYAG